MRAHLHVLICVTAAAVIGLAGCGSESRDTNEPTATVGTEGGQVEIGNTINYGSVGTTADIDCADGKSLNVGGSNNKLTVKGSCSNVNVGGADNTITLERVDKELSIVGFNNKVTYRDGNPSINNTGSGNSVSKG